MIESTRDILAETHLYCLALAVYFEGGSTVESEEGQRHIARVVAERAKANRRKWGGGDICDVVFYRKNGVCQFSFACLPSARRTLRCLATSLAYSSCWLPMLSLRLESL